MLIAIDHGNKQIKTVHTQPFTSGLIQGDTPGFGTDCLAYQGKYYTLTDRRIPYRRDKTEDERFFILTLFAIAYEIEAMGRYSDTLMRIQLAVGLPPAHFGVQAKRFINYFDGRGAISFQFRGRCDGKESDCQPEGAGGGYWRLYSGLCPAAERRSGYVRV